MFRKHARLLGIFMTSCAAFSGPTAIGKEQLSEAYRLKLAAPSAYQLQVNGPDRTIGLPHDAAVREAAHRQHLDAALLHAVMFVESGNNAKAVSPAGAVGLMQLMPTTAKRFGVVDLRSPSENLRGGAAYLRWLLDRFDQDVELALAAYNAGEGAVEAHGRRIPPYPETRHYVPKVAARYRDLKQSNNPYRLDPASIPGARQGPGPGPAQNRISPELPIAAVKYPSTQ